MPLSSSRVLRAFMYALYFDGVDDYVRVPYFGESRRELTVMLWFNLGEVADGFNSLVGRSNEHNYGWRLFQDYNTTRVVFAYQGVDGVKRWILGTGGMSLSVWYHVAVTFSVSATRAYLYLNGILIAGSTAVIEIGDKVEDVHIGGRFGLSTFKGLIKGVFIYNRALSPSEVSWNYQNLYNPVRDDLVLCLIADPQYIRDIDGDGVLEWVDLSGFGNHGKIYGATLVKLIRDPVR